MKFYTYFFTLIGLFSSQLFAQISLIGKPIIYKDKIEKTTEFYATPKFNVQAQLDSDEQLLLTGEKIYRFGKEFPVSINLFEQSKRTVLPNGDLLYQYGISCPNALTINVIFDQFKLADGVNVYIADVNKRDYDGAYTKLNNNVNNVLGTDIIYSEQAIIEIYVPKESEGKSQLHLGTIIHGYKDLNEMAKALNSSGSCQIDVNCPLGSGWENQRNSVAIMLNGGSFCTGSLINNTSGTIIPYFITANHCGTTPANWVFRFRWESPEGQVDCGTNAPSVDGPTTMNVNGGVLRSNYSNSDFTFIELNSAPDPAWGIYYNGWDHSGLPPTQCTGIHHPSGDIKKISRDEDDAIDASWSGTQQNSHWKVPSWDQGTTEGGSSGSPLFDQNKRFVGQLHGGPSGCGVLPSNMNDDYGKFSVSWNGNGTTSTSVGSWLDPINSGTLILDGVDPALPSKNVDALLFYPKGVHGVYCRDSVVRPEIKISNAGANTLTSATITYGFDGATILNYSWTGSLATFQSEAIILPAVIAPSGSHSFKAYVTSPNNTLDENNLNDTIVDDFRVILDGEFDTLKLNLDQYGSETSWNLKDNNNTVLYTGGPYQDTSACVTTLVKVPLCLQTGCYTFTINDQYSDGLSTVGCPGSYSIERPFGQVLASLSTLSANFGSAKSDPFCLSEIQGIDELEIANKVVIYPNPAMSEITIETKDLNPTNIEVASIVGQSVFTTLNVSTLTKVDVSNFSKGIYLVKINTNSGVILKQVVVQ